MGTAWKISFKDLHFSTCQMLFSKVPGKRKRLTHWSSDHSLNPEDHSTLTASYQGNIVAVKMVSKPAVSITKEVLTEANRVSHLKISTKTCTQVFDDGTFQLVSCDLYN